MTVNDLEPKATAGLVAPSWGKWPFWAGLVSLIAWIAIVAYYRGCSFPDDMESFYLTVPLVSAALSLALLVSGVPLAIRSRRAEQRRWGRLLSDFDPEQASIKAPVLRLLACGVVIGLPLGWVASYPLAFRVACVETLVPQLDAAIKAAGKLDLLRFRTGSSLGEFAKDASAIESTMREADEFFAHRSSDTCLRFHGQLLEFQLYAGAQEAYVHPDRLRYPYLRHSYGTAQKSAPDFQPTLVAYRRKLEWGLRHRDGLVAGACFVIASCPLLGLALSGIACRAMKRS